MKTCKDCGLTKPLAEFGHKGDRYLPRCVECNRRWKRAYVEGERKMECRRGEIASGPFCEWLAWLLLVCGDDHHEVAERIGKHPRFVYRWLYRPSPWLMETTVDEMFCNAGYPQMLRILYPELYESVAA